MTRVFWDTNLFVYLLEGGPRADRVRELRTRMAERGDRLVTSSLTLGELLVKPVALSPDAAAAHERAVRQTAEVLPFDDRAALAYARIRQDRSIKAPDAVQLACAAAGEVDLFITNDDRLSRKVVPGVKFIVSLERAHL